MKFAVIGAGSWGTTLANLLCHNGNHVKLWAREPEVVAGINNDRRNPFFVNHLSLHDQLHCSDDLAAVLDNAQLALISVPSGFIRSVIEPYKEKLKKLDGIANVAKGFERGSGRRISQVICEILGVEPDSAADHVACLSGPNLADEVAQKKLGASVIASPDAQLSQKLQECFSTPYFRVYRHSDRKGVELGGTLKNIFAIGAGIVDGLELGDNAKAAYLTRSLHELVRLGTALGGEAQTFYGLTGLGDLMATASSPLSRNHRLGQAIAQGVSLQKFTESTKMVVEGVEAAKIANEWGKKLTLQLPITEELCRVLFEGRSPDIAAANLMGRSLKAETD
ncbi:MAG TPA: NAD(P)H-dependent glycerol-3-phosphate dehydrogenase [Candidatus Rifleibacterium sp.]|nr:NAD(P)H-dependent glycerol-3-phosphate dehydrogenase [Candidatus Rifleibacterium sp.]HPT44929.1 NAD(P)H-dependent glycerol-3-phosphate dehydrogenase [Candidatus Rifleibacterium sp.]